MPTLRKMLGKIDSPECIALMRLIETQSKTTLASWAVDYASLHHLPILEKYVPDDMLLFSQVADACRSHLNGQLSLAMLKPVLKTCRERASVMQQPIAQAAARALSTAFATAQTPTNALGYLFYGAAAVAYDEAGLTASIEIYDALATKELQRAYQALQTVAVPDEPNPAKINWNC